MPKNLKKLKNQEPIELDSIGFEIFIFLIAKK